MKNSYNVIKGKNTGKGIARREMVNAIALSDTTYGKILTLPNVDWYIEQMIHTEISKRFSYVAVEYNTDTYFKMIQTLASKKKFNNVTTHNGMLSDMIYGNTENAYSHIIADYCGTLQKQHAELEYALKNKIVEVNGTISITLNERIIGASGLRFEKKMIKGFKKRGKITRYEHMLRCFITKHSEGNFEIETVRKYQDRKTSFKGANMILMIVRRIK